MINMWLINNTTILAHALLIYCLIMVALLTYIVVKVFLGLRISEKR